MHAFMQDPRIHFSNACTDMYMQDMSKSHAAHAMSCDATLPIDMSPNYRSGR